MRRMYDYVCKDCGEIKEAYMDSESTSYLVCMECGGEMHRVISAPKVLKPGGDEGQAYKAIQEINKKDKIKKERIYSR